MKWRRDNRKVSAARRKKAIGRAKKDASLPHSLDFSDLSRQTSRPSWPAPRDRRHASPLDIHRWHSII